MKNNIKQHHFQKLLFGAKLTIFEDLHTGVFYISYHDARSSTLFPMPNANGTYVISDNIENSNFHFSKLLVEDDNTILGASYKQKIVYYHEMATNVIYIQHNDFVSSSIAPLAKKDGSFFTFSEWNNFYNS